LYSIGPNINSNEEDYEHTLFQKSQDAIAALTPEQYRVTQKTALKRPGTVNLLNNKQPGIYVDLVSGEPLFPLCQV